MKAKILIPLATLALLSSLNLELSTALAQVTSFTYQGRLNSGTNLANGSYDLMFSLFIDNVGGNPVAGPVTNSAMPISNGLFTATVDLGANFPGAGRWLEINVRTNSAVSFTTLAPRQLLTPAPYAITANTASNLLGVLPAGQITGRILNASLPVSPNFSGMVTANNFSGNGANVTNVNAATLGGLDSSNFWKTTGNGGTTVGTHFLGTMDNQPLELKANGERALRLEPTFATSSSSGAPNVIGGSASNFVQVTVIGATIAGGGAAVFSGLPHPNGVNGDFATVGGGRDNTSGALGATIAGGILNTGSGVVATIGGGWANTGSGSFATVAGGETNRSQGTHAVASGGLRNTAAGHYSTVSGGQDNTANGYWATVSGGVNNVSANWADTVGGGEFNSGTGFDSTVGGGSGNTASGGAATVGGGSGNVSSDFYATVGGGARNISSNAYATVPGGFGSVAGGFASFAAGHSAQALHSGAFVWGDSTGTNIASTDANSVTMRASGGYRLFSESAASVGAFLAPGSGSWTAMSDRNVKENFCAADARSVLEKVVALPVQTWNYKSQDANIRHIGPMAQDFKAAFQLGESETGIATVDADGVALAAIQGLNQKVENENAALRAENAELKARLEKLERRLDKTNDMVAATNSQ